jgi:hypothetical protein
MDRKILTINVAKQIAQKRHKPISQEELIYLKQRIKCIDKNILINKKMHELLPALVEIYEKELIKLPKSTQYESIDIHDVLVKEIGKESESISGPKNIEKDATIDSLLQKPKLLQRIFNPQVLRYKTYLILDRKYQSQDSNNTTEFRWYVTDISHPHTSNMAVSSMPIRDVVSIKMYPFMFPSALYALNSTKRLSVEIDELKNQAYIIPAYKKRFHFVFSMQSTSSDTYPQYNIDDLGNSDCVFDFHDPILELNSITLRFGNPFNNITLDPDRLLATISADGVQTLLTFNQPHHLNLYDTITIENFSTTDPNTDQVAIDQINNKNGWIVTALTATSATIDVDLSSIVGTIVNNPYLIYFESKRFVIRLEVICVK